MRIHNQLLGLQKVSFNPLSEGTMQLTLQGHPLGYYQVAALRQDKLLLLWQQGFIILEPDSDHEKEVLGWTIVDTPRASSYTTLVFVRDAGKITQEGTNEES